MSNSQIKYPDVLAALGRFIAKHDLTHVNIMEFEQGFILVGEVFYEVGEVVNRRTETHIFSNDELQKMLKGG